MAKKPDGRTFNVSVIGLSGTEKEKGAYGVGKSCLCNRFIHPEADKYYMEHISFLSQSDFGGRVINNDHFLYWGEVTKTDEGNNFTFHVIEQTEFIDDVSFTPFKTGRTDPYTKRCVQTKVQSAEKLMYICKDQLGMETDSTYEQKLMPDGKMNIDGIVCCFDVSKVADRSLEKQVEFCVLLLNNAMKTKKPVVLVTTKTDSVDADYAREVEKLLTRKEFKSSIPMVETSAHDNVNVEAAFLLLGHMMMDKSKFRTKAIPFNEASKARKEVMEVAKEAFRNLLRNKITDSKINWVSARKKLEKEPDYQHFVDLFGTDKARVLVRQHTRHLREELVKHKQNLFLKRLPDVLAHFLPDLETVGDRKSWTVCQNQMMRDDDFDQFFVKVCEDGDSWTTTEFVDDVQENRLPLDLLASSEAETCFRNHVNALQAARRKEELKNEFWALLEKNIDKPGGLLTDHYTLFLGKESYTGLQEHERQQVYDEFQRQLKNRLRIEFQELLWERPSVFRNLNLNQNLTEDDLNVIYNSLNDDQRFRKFHKLEDDRKVMLLNHVVFLEKPSVDRCFFHTSMSEDCTCAECQVSHILRNERRLVPNGRSHHTPDSISSGPIVRPLNLVLLGIEGLATELFTEIRSMCIDDEYKVAHRVYSLDYRPIEGDVTEEGNSFIAPNFKPHGCICVYNSQESLEYIRSSILKTLEANHDQTLDGLPLVIMLAYEPYTMKEVNYLRENGKVLARSMQCEFVDIPEDDLAEKLKFYPEQIEQALNSIIKGPGQSVGERIMEDTEPDLRILLCMMCSDPFPMSLPVQPFLNESSFVVTSDPETSSVSPEEDNVFTIDMNLEYSKQKVEITVTSYHGGHSLVQKGFNYHGFILVYCPKRRASLASLKAFAETVSPAYMLFLAVPEGGASRYNMNEHSQGMKDGKELAKKLSVYYSQFSQNFKTQTASQIYQKFLHDVWEHRDEMEEDMYEEERSPPPAYDANYHRPAAPLPNQFQTNKSTSSNSQSTEDSEPLYDQPHVLQHHSDSERASSPSPPPLPSSSPPPPVEVPFYRNDHELVKPSMLKEKRNQYAGQARDQYRKSFPIGECELMKMRSGMSQSLTEHLDSEAGASPHYQFRKSRSMKLAVKDEVEAWAINEPKRTSKSAYFNSQGRRLHESPYDTAEHQGHDDDEDVVWSQNPNYERSSFISHQPSAKNKPFLFAQYALPQRPGQGNSRAGRVQAPLAMPEKIEISEVYGTVKDALYVQDSDYALVDDALPQGKIHRIKSTSRKNEKGTDSEESEFSSLERDKKKDPYSKVNRKPTPHKKKHKHRNQEGPFITQINIEHPQHQPRWQTDQDRVTEHGGRGRSNSPSEDSAGTGDELQPGTRVKRRSIKKKMSSGGSGTHLSDSDLQSSVHGLNLNDEDDTGSTEVLIHKVGSEDNDLDLNESGSWGTWFKKKPGKDPMKTLEKRKQDEERRRQRENEKKQKEQQRLQKKMTKKKDSKAAGQSESGISLSDFSMSPNNPSVPQFIEKCVEFIESEGLHAEGIYRIPGNKAQVDLLTAKYNEDSNVDISSLDIQVNAVATVLKAFFADLSDPLVPMSLYDELIEASERTKDCLDPGVVDKSSRIIALRGVFLKMHPLNFEVLKFLITHLHKVSKNCDQNSMDSKNLSRCWWPTLFRMEFDSFEKMTKYSRIPEEILQTLIEQCSFFFHSGNEI
ncbi:rho GTPase-activating protein 190-like isoform X4 [Mercenaria mercenaria]|uniref:rho GTPase-activating protein 190-like isoform X4 n=1 Tax=Mercenaria mercenaria TaxID=6596 RepID=UPI00234E6448|nr:rho GTPase-activating protein 190-like isoform X4 [Mercenaria mercenaria]